MIYKLSNREEFLKRWEVNINNHPKDDRWQKWQQQFLRHFDNKDILYFVAIDGERIIGELTVFLRYKYNYLVTKNIRAYLEAFRIDKEYEGKGYFSNLYKFAEVEMKKQGYRYLTIGVEPCEKRNYAIYKHWGFKFIKQSIEKTETNKTGEEPEYITVDYLEKEI